ncbi:integrin beta-1-A-like [Branchiostoma lanceolatum]|uniref:integrin beta-1-A-like n=1 Tax=Branchiostoma lanceolatum TaxID=7740 RepID=UPI003455F8DA
MPSKREAGSSHLGILLCLLVLASLAKSDQECSAPTCADCLRQGPKCGWCAEEGYQGPRCDLVTTLQKNACLSTKIQNPTTDGPTKTKARTFLGPSSLFEPLTLTELRMKKGKHDGIWSLLL